MFATDFFGTKVLNTFNGTTALAQPRYYCGLFLSNPGKSGVTGNEIAYAGYTRPEITFIAPYADNNAINIRNSNDLLWGVAPSDVGIATHIGIFDSAISGSGNMWLFGELTLPLEIRANQQPSIYAGDVIYFITGNFSDTFKTRILNLMRGTNIPGFTPHLALFDGDPEAAGGELAGGSYARPEITFNAPSAQIGGQMQIQNTNLVRFPAPSTPWGLWAWDGIMDAIAGGNLVIKMPNPTPEILQKNYVPMVNPSDYKVAVI